MDKTDNRPSSLCMELTESMWPQAMTRIDQGAWRFRQYIGTRVEQALKIQERTGTLPDNYLIRFDFPAEWTPKVIPADKMWYYWNSFHDTLRWANMPPAAVISLRDAVFCRQEGIDILSPQGSRAQLWSNIHYSGFMEDAGPDTPVATIGFARYRAVEAGAGTVLFSKCEGWQKEVQAYMQKIERDYFDPSILSHSLKTYDVVTNLDHLSKDLRDAVRMPTFMHRDGLIPDPLTSPTEYGCDPVALKGQIVCRDYDASPRYANHGLFLHVEDVPSCGENRDIAKLLDIRDNGTSRAHYYPQFKYKGDFNALYEQWKKAEHWPEDTGKQQTRLCTEILKRDFPTLAQWVLLPKKRRQVLSKPPKTGHGIKH